MRNKITYTRQGDYLFPNLKLPEQLKMKSVFGVSGYGILRGVAKSVTLIY